MYFPFSNLKVQNSYFLEYLGNEKVTLKASKIKQFKEFNNAIQNIMIEPNKIQEIVFSIPEADWTDDLSSHLSSYLKKLVYLKNLKIDASKSNITNFQLSQIILSLSDLQNLSSFSLLLDRCFNLSEGYLEIIFKIISKLQNIELLSINNSQNISQGRYFSYLSECLQYKQCNLKELSLNYFQNSFDQEAHAHLCKGIAKNSHLQVLVLNSIQIFPLFWVLLIEGLQSNTSLQILQVDFVDKQNNSQLAKGLIGIYQTVSSIFIQQKIRNHYIQLFQSLQNSKKIEMFGAHQQRAGFVNCYPQHEDDENSITLQATRTQSALDFKNILQQKASQPQQVHKIVINMQESNWNDELSTAVSFCLKQLLNLQDVSLNFSNSNIQNQQLNLILSALTSLKKIEKFVLRIHQCHDLSQGYLQIIFKYLQSSKSQKFVQIFNGENKSNGSDYKTLADYLIGNTILEELNLQSFENSYDSEAHSYLCRALSKNNHLQKLVLQTIVEPPKFWDNLLENLSVNSSLQNLFIRFLGGCNEKKLAVALNNLYKTISPVIIAVNSPHSSIQNFRELQQIKQEIFLQLTVFSSHIKPVLAVNPSEVAADLLGMDQGTPDQIHSSDISYEEIEALDEEDTPQQNQNQENQEKPQQQEQQ
ncbi:hypothetical protein ABPG74_003842 [Tetrahymena malaccensis]